MGYSNWSYIWYTPGIKEIKARRTASTNKKLGEYELEFSILNTKLSNLRDNRKKTNADVTIPTQNKLTLLRNIERKGKITKQKMEQVLEEIKLRKDRLVSIQYSWSYTHCFACRSSIKRSGQRCPKCKWFRCPKCFACLCWYNSSGL